MICPASPRALLFANTTLSSTLGPKLSPGPLAALVTAALSLPRTHSTVLAPASEPPQPSAADSLYQLA